MAKPKFGRYEVLDEIGRGNMGIVYRAKDPAIGRSVAIKAINKSFLESMEVGADEFLERFRREAQVAGALAHPNVIKVYDLGDDYIVMEFIDGESLDRLLRARPLPAARKLAIIAQIGDALDYAHRQGIVHRDIKPANVMIERESGTVKVMDFGLARVASSNLTTAGAVLGSASYMAPEIVLGKTADARSDIFSLGVLAYEVLTGRRPFSGKTVSVILSKIVGEEAPHAATLKLELPPGFDAIFQRALAKEPARRYANVLDFTRELAGQTWPETQGAVEAPAEGSLVIVSQSEIGVARPASEQDDQAGLATMLDEEAAGEAPATLLMPGRHPVDEEAATLVKPGEAEADEGAATVLTSGGEAEQESSEATLLMPEGQGAAPAEKTVLMPERGVASGTPPASASKPRARAPRPVAPAHRGEEELEADAELEPQAPRSTSPGVAVGIGLLVGGALFAVVLLLVLLVMLFLR